MSEYDAHNALTDTARLRILDPLEQTQLMSFSERRYRAREARQQMLDAAVADDVHRYRRLIICSERITREEALRRWPAAQWLIPRVESTP